jgi:hypothetical protein
VGTRFNPGAPLSAGLVVMRHKKKTKNGVDVWRGTVIVDAIMDVAREANRLNMELQTLSALLTAGRGPIPSDVQIV